MGFVRCQRKEKIRTRSVSAQGNFETEKSKRKQETMNMPLMEFRALENGVYLLSGGRLDWLGPAASLKRQGAWSGNRKAWCDLDCRSSELKVLGECSVMAPPEEPASFFLAPPSSLSLSTYLSLSFLCVCPPPEHSTLPPFLLRPNLLESLPRQLEFLSSTFLG